MKVAAHPLIVAAAFGLLGPAALAEDERDDAKKPCAHCDCGATELAMLDCSDLDDEPTAEDFARIEAEFQAAVVELDRRKDLAVS